MTQAQRNAISSPAGGLMIYQTDNNPGFYYYNGSSWTTIGQAPDGTETKVNSGASINVTGTGTQASPYVPSLRTQSVTRTQRLAIASPITGQIVWCSDCGPSGEMQIYNGTSWATWCGGTTAPALPAVTTTSVSSITGTTASSGGNGTSDGGGTVTARGVCWSTSSSPTTANSKTTDGSGTGSFTSSITGLSLGTTYYVRAYATNATGTSYGNEVSFTTVNLATLTTTAISSITGISASSGGNISADGGGSVTARGVCWSTSSNPTTANSYTTNGTGTGTFTSSITGLSNGTTYYVRAYATNAAGTAYGNQQSFTTLSVPTLTTTSASSITETDAWSGGNISSDGGASVTQKGVCWSTSSNPTTANSKTTNGGGTGSFSSYISGLSASTTYYVRAYATNSIGTAYGNQITFTTMGVPILTTTAVSSITGTTASSGGTISSDGGYSITAKGICWSTSSNPTISDNTTNDGSGTASYTSSMTGLTPGTTYYVRAYATNSMGTGYGSQVSFVTLTLPTVTTSAASMTGAFTGSGGGNVTSEGSSSVTAKGVCWSVYSSPTISNPKTTDGSGLGSFTSSLTGLTPNTTFYVRAYATSAAGTAYGNQVSFTTRDLMAGDTYQGGKIAHIYQFGDTPYLAGVTDGFIVTASDISSGAQWGCYGSGYGATNMAVGYGEEMSNLILSNCPTSGIAARVCTESTSGGYDDWYLPNAGEMNRIYNNRVALGMSGNYNYWTSNEVSGSETTNAYYWNMNNSLWSSTAKTSSLLVRGIRNMLRIGDIWQGGIIAYILRPGDAGYVAGETHGLLISYVNLTTTGAWGCATTNVNGGEGTAIGTGNQNTLDIINGCGTANIAADLCYDYTGNGKTDWYLPSKDELNSIYSNMTLINNSISGNPSCNILSSDYYWSSTEVSSSTAFAQTFSNGTQAAQSKNNTYRVRAVRSF